jgi:transposase
MAMGRRRTERQEALFVEAEELARAEGRTFYTVLNDLLTEYGFDRFCEGRVASEKVFDETMGRPSVPPGIYFRMLLVGYFEGLSSERGIAWWCADSLSLREFLGYELTERTPDHSTLSGLRRKLPVTLHREIFEWVLQVAREEGILKGRRVALDATTLQANASMKKSLVRRCDGSSYQKYLKKLAKAEGIEEPTKEDLQRLDKGRKGKKLSNASWKSSTDSEARITKMKDGTTRLAYKAENAVDLPSGVIVAAEVHGADQGDTATMPKTLLKADEAVMDAGIARGIAEVVADRGYHADAAIDHLQTLGYRTCIAERPQKRNWKAVARRVGQETMRRLRQAFHRNRRRLRSAAGRQLQKLRAEYPERSFAHLFFTGGLRRVWVRGQKNVLKRLQLHAAAANLGIVIRHLFGFGTPRSLQGRLAALLAAFSALVSVFRDVLALIEVFPPLSRFRHDLPNIRVSEFAVVSRPALTSAFSTGC